MNGHFEGAHDRKEAENQLIVNLAEEREEQVEESCINPPVSSSFQLIQTRLIRPFRTTCCTPPTINLRGNNHFSSQYHLAPLSVYQDSLEHIMPVRLIVRGDMQQCRRRLLKKSLILNEATGSTKRARIEDYLDPLLLSDAAQKIRSSCSKQEAHRTNSAEMDSSDLAKGVSRSFDWPSADLQAMTSSTPAHYAVSSAQQLLRDDKGDDLQINHGGYYKSKRALFQGQGKYHGQNIEFMKNSNSQFSSCGWSISGYNDPCSYGRQSSGINASVVHYDSGFEGSPLRTPPTSPSDTFQNFDTTVRLFQT